MARGDLDLELERRRAVIELVENFPGLHLSEIARRLGWTPMLAEYHLRVLERHRLVSSLQEDRYRRYYPTVERSGLRVDSLGAREKRILGLLRHPVRLHIVAWLVSRPRSRNKDLAHELGLSRPATSYQLNRLVHAEIVMKDEQDRYTVVDAATVSRLLMAHRPPADLVERFRAVWDSLGPSV